MIRIGLLGCGRIGQVHGRTLSRMAQARVVAVSDAVPAAAEALAASLSAEVRDSHVLIDSADIDAVVIGTPTDTHYDLIHRAAAAGKAIFCEKPVDMSVARIRECQKVVEAAGVAFLTAFNRRFDPSFAAMQAAIRDGQIGRVELVTILSRDPAPPPISYIKSSGGIFRDMMIHDLDMARFLTGEDPVEVFARGSALVDPEIGAAGDVDTAAVTLTMPSGALVQISNSRRATYGYDQRAEVHGALGMLSVGNMPETQMRLANTAGFRSSPAMNFFLERYEDAYAAEMNHFIDCLVTGTPPSPSITDGLKAQMLADAAAQSLDTGAPVAVS